MITYEEWELRKRSYPGRWKEDEEAGREWLRYADQNPDKERLPYQGDHSYISRSLAISRFDLDGDGDLDVRDYDAMEADTPPDWADVEPQESEESTTSRPTGPTETRRQPPSTEPQTPTSAGSEATEQNNPAKQTLLLAGIAAAVLYGVSK